jgi:hypothetical protein
VQQQRFAILLFAVGDVKYANGWALSSSDTSSSCWQRLVQQARLVRWDHILDVDECILATLLFKRFQRLVDEITDILSLLLAVIDAVARVEVLLLENVKHRQDLSVVRDQCFANKRGRGYQRLQDLQGAAHDLVVSGVEGRLNWDNQLWNHWQNFRSSKLEHVLDASTCEKVIWVRCLAKTIEEERQVMVEIEFLNLNLPCNLVSLGIKLNSNWEITPLVELSEL